jgi:hypothetical protein
MTTKAGQARPAVAVAAPAPQAKAATLKTPVTVNALLMGKGDYDWVIHLQGCKQYAAAKKRSSYAGLDDYTIEGVRNQREVIMEVWSDQIHETYQDDTPKGKTAADEAEAPMSWLNKHNYTQSVQFHTCLAGLPAIAKGAATGTASATAASARKAAKTELATLVAEAAGRVVQDILDANLADPDSAAAVLIHAGYKGDDEIRQCVAQWLHGMPTDRKRFLAVLPRPDRSDWREENDAANSAEEAPATEAAAETTEADTTDTGE